MNTAYTMIAAILLSPSGKAVTCRSDGDCFIVERYRVGHEFHYTLHIVDTKNGSDSAPYHTKTALLFETLHNAGLSEQEAYWGPLETLYQERGE